MTDIQNMVVELLSIVRIDRSLAPTSSSMSDARHSSDYSDPSPSLSTPTAMLGAVNSSLHQSPTVTPGQGADSGYLNRAASILLSNPTNMQQSQTLTLSRLGHHQHSSESRFGQEIQPVHPLSESSFSSVNALYTGRQGPTLPPITTLHESGASRPGPSNISSMRYHPGDALSSSLNNSDKHLSVSTGRMSPPPRKMANSNATSSNTSDVDEDDTGELPKSGLIAPWEVLRGLADVAVKRAAQVGLCSYPSSIKFIAILFNSGERRVF